MQPPFNPNPIIFNERMEKTPQKSCLPRDAEKNGACEQVLFNFYILERSFMAPKFSIMRLVDLTNAWSLKELDVHYRLLTTAKIFFLSKMKFRLL